jgi:hypothetical protein
MSGQEGLTLYRMSRRFPAGRAAQDRKAVFALETASFLLCHNSRARKQAGGHRELASLGLQTSAQLDIGVARLTGPARKRRESG